MTRHGDRELLARHPKRGMPRWLALAITTLALSTPVGGVLVLMWPVLLRRTSGMADGIEMICLVIATILIGGAMTSYIHRSP